MTRINCIDPSELTRQHLIAEIRELPRVFTLARKATQQHNNVNNWKHNKKPPVNYVLGTGHVNFHVDKLSYLAVRYSSLCHEWRSRGYKVNQVCLVDLCEGIDSSFFNSYTPTPEAIQINRQRIAERLSNS